MAFTALFSVFQNQNKSNNKPHFLFPVLEASFIGGHRVVMVARRLALSPRSSKVLALNPPSDQGLSVGSLSVFSGVSLTSACNQLATCPGRILPPALLQPPCTDKQEKMDGYVVKI